ncbi:ATP-dependent helicase [Baekduia soli]|uniref:DNA 3'-5' helicase n=1 Tax=Baekduia soli TaxID=496014 RepID=A0A5B8U0U3_9ACTN|nr:ATP-dependent DNA helicase [Baekduia soli]QEC46608.1 ATP-dependent helicase [Baekduia soli]
MPASPGAFTPEDHHARSAMGPPLGEPAPATGPAEAAAAASGTPALTADQQGAVDHRGGPLVILGGAGSGRTQALVARFAALVAEGVAPEDILLLTRTAAAADALHARVHDALGDRPFEELPVLPVHGMCARLLRDEALEAGIDPFAVTATPADRLALLLDRVDELTLRRHDLRGRPAAVLGAVLARIDRLKEAGVRAGRFAEWAATLAADTERGEREREFAGLFEAHDRLLLAHGLLDFGELVLRSQELLERRPHVRERTAARWRHVLVDDLEDLTPAQAHVVTLLAAEHGDLAATADDDQAVGEPRAVAARLQAFVGGAVGGRPVHVVRLSRSLRCPERIVTAAEAVVAPIADRLDEAPDRIGSGAAGDVRLWRCATGRAQAQGVAAAVERLVREGTRPGRIGVLVRSVRNEGQELAVALEERALPYRLAGAAAFFGQAEVRDVLAWLRLLVDPGDAGAVVRALARPPIELHAVDLARCIQIARRRKLDMVSALVAATESPQLPPEARERVLAFLKLHRQAAAALDTTRPDLFVHRLIERLGLRRQQVFAAQADVVERLVSLARVGELAASYARRAPQATPREFARWLAAVAEAGGMHDAEDEDEGQPRDDAVAVLPLHAAKGLEFDHVFVCGLQASRMPGARRQLIEPIPAELLGDAGEGDSREEHLAEMRRVLHVAMTRAREGLVLAYAVASERGSPQHPSPFAEEARAALGAEWEDVEEQLFGPDEALHATIGQLRDELLADVQQIGTRLGELRLDTDLDVAHGVTRYLELLKLSALLARPTGQPVADALPGINAAILQAATGQQREILQTSSLDEVLLGAERDAGVRAAATAARHEPSLAPFLPRRGDGLALSASDIETYRTCPLKYKFARVFRVPQEPTINQRFGIVVHQVLERYHQGSDPHQPRSIDELLGLLEAGWRRSGFGATDEERQLRGKAETALRRYHQRFQAEDAEPMWFEKSFTFKIGPHVLRGRVDRVDRLPDGRYELIDYKTGRPRTAAQLRDDVQLALYAVAATQAWGLEASRQSYLYVLDDRKVPLPDDGGDAEWISETVLEVGDGILGQGFEPTPSYAACSICDYRIACPASER